MKNCFKHPRWKKIENFYLRTEGLGIFVELLVILNLKIDFNFSKLHIPSRNSSELHTPLICKPYRKQTSQSIHTIYE